MPLKSRTDYPVLILSAAAMTFAASVVCIAMALSFGMLPKALNATPWDAPRAWKMSGIGLGLLLLTLGFCILAQVKRKGHDPATSASDHSLTLYGVHLVGIGYSFVVLAIVCCIMFAAVSWSAAQKELSSNVALQSVFSATDGFSGLFGKTTNESAFILGMFLLSCLLSVLGAMFFFSTALWLKIESPNRELFDVRIFWAGLWFRIAEALVFNLVFFLVLRYYAPSHYLLLPLVSLLVGMFLKSGESLITGIANRIFDAVKALVPAELGERKTMKLATFEIVADGGSDLATGIPNLVAALKALTGVTDVSGELASRLVKVEYDGSAVSVADFRRKVALHGLSTTAIRVD